MSRPDAFTPVEIKDSTLTSEVQTVTVTDGSGADAFTLTVPDGGDRTTGSLNWDVSAADMQAALEALGNVGAGNIAVTKSGGVYTLTYQGTLAGAARSQLTSTPTGCTVAHATTQQGHQQALVTGPGVLSTITIGYKPTTAGFLTFYDGDSSSDSQLGTPIGIANAAVPAGPLIYPSVLTTNWRFKNGLFVDAGTLATFSVAVAYARL